MSMMSEFRKFAIQGNVVDLAVGVIIGAAFAKIVDSAVKDLIMPIAGAIFGGLDFSNYFVTLAKVPADFKGPMTYEALTKAGVPLFAYGNFITILLNFLILAFIIFQMVRAFNLMKDRAAAALAAESAKAAAAEPPAPPPAPTPSEVLLAEIRDALVKR